MKIFSSWVSLVRRTAILGFESEGSSGVSCSVNKGLLGNGLLDSGADTASEVPSKGSAGTLDGCASRMLRPGLDLEAGSGCLYSGVNAISELSQGLCGFFALTPEVRRQSVQ
jgi:hypothetical protein